MKTQRRRDRSLEPFRASNILHPLGEQGKRIKKPKRSFRPKRRRASGRSVVESRVRETAPAEEMGGKPLIFLRAGEGGGRARCGSAPPSPERQSERFAPISSTGLSRGLGSPLRSAHLSTYAPVEMTVFGFDAFALRPAVSQTFSAASFPA